MSNRIVGEKSLGLSWVSVWFRFSVWLGLLWVHYSWFWEVATGVFPTANEHKRP